MTGPVIAEQVTVTEAVTVTPGRLTVAPAAASVSRAMPPATVTDTAVPVAPAGVVVAAAAPTFIASVDSSAEQQRVEVAWATTTAFTDGATASAAAPAGLDDAQVPVVASAPLADGVWWWRARVTGPYGAGAWSAPVQFAVNTDEGEALAAGTLNVTGAAHPAPHVWCIDHTRSGADIGDTVIAIGTGFGSAPQVTLGGTVCTVTGVATVPAVGATIDADLGVFGPWHQELAFLVPDVGADSVGDTLTVLPGS